MPKLPSLRVASSPRDTDRLLTLRGRLNARARCLLWGVVIVRLLVSGIRLARKVRRYERLKDPAFTSLVDRGAVEAGLRAIHDHDGANGVELGEGFGRSRAC